MEQNLRIEKVQNGVIFTNENDDRFVDSEPKLPINEIVDRILKAVEAIGDVTVIIATPDRPVNDRKGY